VSRCIGALWTIRRVVHILPDSVAARAADGQPCAMSFLLADPGELFAIADRISRHADALRVRASTLAAAIANDQWHGFASDVFSAEARGLLHDMRGCAARLDDAADALRRHANRVQAVFAAVKRLWHDIENAGLALAHDVSHLVLGADELVVEGILGDLTAQAR
jgi:uncharacterized protein YukE